MDAFLLDQMLPDYQERQQEVMDHTPQSDESSSSNTGGVSHETESSSSSEKTYQAELGRGATVPVTDEVDLVQAAMNLSDEMSNLGPGSAHSSSSSSSYLQDNHSRGSASIYHPTAICPSINYERESPHQKLVAVFGRQFDLPSKVASSLQKLVSMEAHLGIPSMKFVPFTMKRKTLLKGVYDSEELRRHDLICMCYNASEARIMLTGRDGFYTSLLQHTEITLG